MGEREKKPIAAATLLTASRALTGMPVLPHQRVQLMSAEEWEQFINEWANSLIPKVYQRVERHAGAGDMGIDVLGILDVDDLFSPWDNFQCKHYDHPLRPSEILVELGKIVYYTWRGDYTTPRAYFFCAPRDVGSTLAKLLRNPAALKE